MDEGLLALFEYIKQDFLSLSLEDFTDKARTADGSALDISSAITSTALASEWPPYWNVRVAAANKSYPLRLREEAYTKLKYLVDEIIAKIKSGLVSLPRKRIAEGVVNKVSDPKIKQICIELNTTPDQNVLSLMQSLGEAIQWTLWYHGYCVQKIGTKIKQVKDLTLDTILSEATDKNKPFYTDNATTRFLNEFHKNFMKQFYDMVRHDPAYIPDIQVINPAIVSLEHLLRVTFL